MKNAFFAVLVCLTAIPTFGQSATFWLSKQVNEETSQLDDTITVDIGSGAGFGASYSSMFSRRLSGELSVFRISADAEVQGSDLGDVDYTPIAAMLRFHFLPGQRFDVYAGAGLAYVIAEDVEDISVDSETSAVIGAGATYDFSNRWGVAADIRYLPFELTGQPAGEPLTVTADINPLLVSAGIRIRF